MRCLCGQTPCNDCTCKQPALQLLQSASLDVTCASVSFSSHPSLYRYTCGIEVKALNPAHLLAGRCHGCTHTSTLALGLHLRSDSSAVAADGDSLVLVVPC
jgi:hypothetical protein